MSQPNTNMRVSKSRVLIIGDQQHCLNYEAILRRNNFVNIQACHDGISGLQTMEHDRPDILIVDADIPEMDGYEIAANVREIERSENCFSYITMITDRAHSDHEYAAQASVDATIPKEAVAFRLIPQMMSAERVSQQINLLLADNLDLRQKCGYLEAGQLLDPLTGLGNRRQAMKGMEDTIRQIESRGGAIALLLIKLIDIHELESDYGREVIEELIVSVAQKIRKLVRPLDIVTYFDNGTFAIVMKHDELSHCRATSYERIRSGLTLKSFQTRAGFLQPSIRIGACGAGAETGPPKTGWLVATAMNNLTSQSSEEIRVTVLDPLQVSA